ncbi:MAG: PrgI family protein [Candidatus Pacebacteria bacterium]|nr:PrgI family protein [Candidatus Paceibacterota bacterium]
MRFTFPQFIEKEIPIIGPLTLRQFISVALGIAICFIIFFSLGEYNFFLWILATITIMATALGFAFLQINGKSLPGVIKNFLFYSIAPKIYLWKKKEVSPKIAKVLEKEVEKETPSLKLAGKSQLKQLSTKIETRIK